MSGLSQDQIAVMFRQGELRRRAERRAQVQQQLDRALALARNEGILVAEKLDDHAQKIHDIAVGQIKEQQLAFEKEVRVSYWRRLWAALLNK